MGLQVLQDAGQQHHAIARGESGLRLNRLAPGDQRSPDHSRRRDAKGGLASAALARLTTTCVWPRTSSSQSATSCRRFTTCEG